MRVEERGYEKRNVGERGRAWRKKKMGKGRGVWGTGVGERGERGRVKKKERERFWIRVHVHLCGYMVKIYWFPSLSLFSFLFSLLPPSFFLPLPLPFIPLFYHPFLFLLPPLLLSTISPPPSLSTAIQSRDG